MKKKAAFLSLLYSLFIYVLVNWDNFQDCYAPIQISLISATSLILGRYIFRCLRIIFNDPCINTILTFLIIWAIPILLIISVIAGLVWLSQNIQYSESCGTEFLSPIMIIFIMAMVFFVDLYFIYRSIVEAFNWNIMRRNHRRIREELDIQYDVVAYIPIQEEVSPKKLSEAQIQKLEIQKCRRSFSMLEVCTICANDYKEGEDLLFVPGCNHHYHSGCVKIWLKMKATCPTCRNDILKHIPTVSV